EGRPAIFEQSPLEFFTIPLELFEIHKSRSIIRFHLGELFAINLRVGTSTELQKRRGPSALVFGEGPTLHQSWPALQESKKRDRSSREQHKWTKPKRIRPGIHRWPVQNEVAVPIRQERGDLHIGPSVLHLFADLLPQI